MPEHTVANSWKGSPALKQAVLSQMQTHYEQAVLEPLQIDGTSVEIYGWPNPPDYAHCAKMLGLEEGMLRLGYYLYEGFPEDRQGIKEVVQSRIEFLESIPAGVDLSGICHEFILWRLENADFGIVDAPSAETIRQIYQEIAAIFYQDVPDFQLVLEKVQKARAETTERIGVLWKTMKKTDLDVHRTLNALATAAAACTAMDNPHSATDTAHLYLFGADGTNVRNLETETERMADKLRQLIASAPKSR